LSVEGIKVVDLCTEGDRLLERGTGAVFNKPIKGVKVNKGVSFSTFFFLYDPVYPSLHTPELMGSYLEWISNFVGLSLTCFSPLSLSFFFHGV